MISCLPSTDDRYCIMLPNEGDIDTTSLIQHDERYAYRLFGYFYCRNVESLNQSDNLFFFFDKLRSEGFENALASIQGGAYSFVILDRNTRMVYAGVDRYGLAPVYYHIHTDDQGCKLEFSFHLDSWPNLPKDKYAIIEFLHYGCLLFSDTFNTGLNRIKAGQYQTFSSNGIQKTSDWWAYRSNRHNVHSAKVDYTDLIEEVDEAFCSFFRKIPIHQGAIAGLSGGFDSRLILGYLERCKIQPIQAVTMGNQGTEEADSAKLIAQTLGVKHNLCSVPHDLMAQHGEAIANSFHLIASLEAAHVDFLGSLVKEALESIPNAAYYDGFLGDVVMGGTYYSEAARTPRGILKDLSLASYKLNSLKSLDTYLDLSLNAKQRVDMLPLPGFSLDEVAREELRERIRIQISPLYEVAQSHEEMINLIRLHQRGYRYISNGPKALFPLLPTYLPFMDYCVQDALDKIPLEKLARHMFYRAFLRSKFPRLSSIPKAYNGSSANSSEFAYRFSQYVSGILRHVVYPRLFNWSSGKIDLNQEYIRIQNYFQDENNIKWLEKIAREKCKNITENQFHSLKPISKLRLISLLLAGYVE